MQCRLFCGREVLSIESILVSMRRSASISPRRESSIQNFIDGFSTPLTIGSVATIDRSAFERDAVALRIDQAEQFIAEARRVTEVGSGTKDAE